jgi:hypothetical protein
MLSPEKMPDPWLFDSHFLLAELARVRELILRIPLHLDTFGPTNTAIMAISEVEDRLRYLLALHTEAQRSWAERQKNSHVKGNGKVVKLSAEQAAMKKRAAQIGGLSG